MSTSRYIKATADGAVDGIKGEWKRTQTFGGVVGYAILPPAYRAPYAVTRAVVAAGTGVVTGVRNEYKVAKAEKATAAEQAAAAETERVDLHVVDGDVSDAASA